MGFKLTHNDWEDKNGLSESRHGRDKNSVDSDFAVHAKVQCNGSVLSRSSSMILVIVHTGKCLGHKTFATLIHMFVTSSILHKSNDCTFCRWIYILNSSMLQIYLTH